MVGAGAGVSSFFAVSVLDFCGVRNWMMLMVAEAARSSAKVIMIIVVIGLGFGWCSVKFWDCFIS